MGTISIGNSGVEKRLDAVDGSVKENTNVLTDNFRTMISRMGSWLTQIKLLNLRTEEAYQTGLDETDVNEDI